MVEYTYYLNIEEEDLVRVRFEKDKGRILVFSIQYETKIGDKPNPIVRYDTAHLDRYPSGHKDELHPEPERNKKIDLQNFGISSLEDAFNYAEKDIKDNWKKYKMRYLNRKKKL